MSVYHGNALFTQILEGKQILELTMKVKVKHKTHQRNASDRNKTVSA